MPCCMSCWSWMPCRCRWTKRIRPSMTNNYMVSKLAFYYIYFRICLINNTQQFLLKLHKIIIKLYLQLHYYYICYTKTGKYIMPSYNVIKRRKHDINIKFMQWITLYKILILPYFPNSKYKCVYIIVKLSFHFNRLRSHLGASTYNKLLSLFFFLIYNFTFKRFIYIYSFCPQVIISIYISSLKTCVYVPTETTTD